MKCAFIGHRDIFGIEDAIQEKINQLINMGVTEFYSGGMGNFDKMCEDAVRRAKAKLTFVAYNYKQIKESHKFLYDNIICPLGRKEYSKFDIPDRNKWMVDNCDIFLCCVHKAGGASKTLDYVIKKNKLYINLAE